MKKNFMFAAALMLLAIAISASAQKATDFSGKWSLDKAKSTLDERMAQSIESQALIVTQTATELKAETSTKRTPPPADAPQGGGRMGGGMMGGGDGSFTYKLDGSETKTEVEGRNGKTPVSLKAKVDGAKLILSRISTMNTQMGEITITTTETWEPGADGKTLTVIRSTESPRGTMSAKYVYTKQ